MTPHDTIIEHTKRWIKSVVIDCNFCPFAARVYHNQSIRYTVCDASFINNVLPLLQAEYTQLDQDTAIETSFLIFSGGFAQFNDYLAMVRKAERALAKEGYEGVYQLASFHPSYCFQGSDEQDAANFTNRSPYPMLHLLREDSLEKALRFFREPEQIPEHNVAFARSKGLAYMQMLLDNCR